MADITIHTLPFHVFKEVILKDDVKLLGCAEEEAPGLWEDILEAYADAIGETNSDGYLTVRRELLYFQTQKYLISVLADRLSEIYFPKWGDMLNKICHTNFKFNPHNRAEYISLLQRCVTRSKGIDIQINLLTQKAESLEKQRQGDGLKPTPEYFAKVLLNLHEFSNWQFDDKEISTFQYCELVRRYHQHIEYLKSKK